jgi:hypothetical protein
MGTWSGFQDDVKQQSNDEPGNADADLFDSFQPSVDRFISDLADRFV